MTITLRHELARDALPPAPDGASVTALVELDAGPAAGIRDTDLRFVLDRSSSMSEPSGRSTKMQVLIDAVLAVLSELRPGGDQLSIDTFDSKHENVLAPTVPDADALSRLEPVLRRLRPRGCTAMSKALRAAVDHRALRPDAERRVVLFTDGHLSVGGDPERRRCLAAAERAGRSGVPLVVLATGDTYDEGFLRELVDLAGAESLYHHVLEVDEVVEIVTGLLRELRSVATHDVTVEFRPHGPAFQIDELLRLVPRQQPVQGLRDTCSALDDRGQRYLVRGTLRTTANGLAPLFDVDVSWQPTASAARQSVSRQVAVQVTDDPARLGAAPVNARVLQTVYTAAGVKATLAGNVAQARTLFTHAGNAPMLQALSAFGSANASSGAARKLRTVAANAAHAGALLPMASAGAAIAPTPAASPAPTTGGHGS